MSLQTLYQIHCDEKDCPHASLAFASESPAGARAHAAKQGWDLGPRRTKTRSGTLIHHTDYCPAHKKRTYPEG